MHAIGLMPPRLGVKAVDQHLSTRGMTACEDSVEGLMQIRLSGTTWPAGFAPLKELDASRESLI
jgi:hypothetical protein